MLVVPRFFSDVLKDLAAFTCGINCLKKKQFQDCLAVGQQAAL
jgi:hypothetical protein